MTTSRRRPTRASQGSPHAAPGPLDDVALLDALQTLLAPLAALAVARGVSHGVVEELVKHAFVQAARGALPPQAGERVVSRISTATGLNRREVTRLLALDPREDLPRTSLATQVFTRWVAQAGARASLRALARQGPAPSFEALARSVTNDVHPRSLLEELCRLGLARLDGERVHLVQDSYVPSDDRRRMLSFLAGNAGDHLRAAVENVLAGAPPHLEQAMYAAELSQASLEEIDAFVRTQWKALMATTVPRIEARLAADERAGAPRDRRVRIGLYMYGTAMGEQPAEAPATVAETATAKSATAKTGTAKAATEKRATAKRATAKKAAHAATKAAARRPRRRETR